MELAPGWTTIVACPVGGRDVVLFYDNRTGRALTAYIDGTGAGVPLKAFDLGAGWSHIDFCNRHVLFFDETTGVAVIGTIGRDGAFEEDSRTSLPPGQTRMVSDGQHLLIYRGDRVLVCTLRPPDGIGILSATLRIERVYPRSGLGLGGVIVAGRDMMVRYECDYRISARISFTWIDARGEWQGHYPSSETDPNWTTVVLSNGWLLYYDEGVGGGKIVTGSPDYVLEYLPWKAAAISSFWTHIVPVGDRLLFYAEYNGVASVGSISPNGEFSGEARF